MKTSYFKLKKMIPALTGRWSCAVLCYSCHCITTLNLKPYDCFFYLHMFFA